MSEKVGSMDEDDTVAIPRAIADDVLETYRLWLSGAGNEMAMRDLAKMLGAYLAEHGLKPDTRPNGPFGLSPGGWVTDSKNGVMTDEMRAAARAARDSPPPR